MPTPVEDSPDDVITDQGYRNHPDHSGHAGSRFPAVNRRAQPVVPSPQQTNRAVSIDDVIKMVQLGLSESTIVRYIGHNGAKQPLNVSDLIRLHEAGVSEPIISALQSARIFTAKADPSPARPRRQVHAVRSEPRASVPSHRLNVEKFGPSILDPQQRPAVGAFDSTEITSPPEW